MTMRILNHSLSKKMQDIVEFAHAEGLAATLITKDEVKTLTLVDSQVSQYFMLSELVQCCPCYDYVNVQKMPKQILYSHLLSYANITSEYFHQVGKGGDSLLFKFKYSSEQFIIIYLQFKLGFDACYWLFNNFLLNKLRELIYSEHFKSLLERCRNIKAHIQPITLSFETQLTNQNDPFEVLTPREKEIVQLCCDYPMTSSIDLAKQIAISSRTFEKHLQSIYRKFSVHSREGVMAFIEPSLHYFY